MFFKPSQAETKSKLQQLIAEEKTLLAQQRHYRLCVEEDYLLDQVKYEKAQIAKRQAFIEFLLKSNQQAPAMLESLNLSLAQVQELISKERARIFSESLSESKPKEKKDPKPKLNNHLTPQEIMIQSLCEIKGISKNEALSILGMETIQ